MNILLADDDCTSRCLLSRIIVSETEHHLVLAKDGEEAWEILRDPSQSFAAGIFDVTMPRLDGFGLVERIREAPALCALQLILCTAHNDRHTVARAGVLSVSHYIVKPFTKVLVLEKLSLVAATLATQVSIEEHLLVAGRLGLAMEDVTELIGGFAGEVHGWLHRARLGRVPADFRQLAIGAYGLKGAALSLGLRALSIELDRVEAAFLHEFAAEARLQFPPSATEVGLELYPVEVQLRLVELRRKAA